MSSGTTEQMPILNDQNSHNLSIHSPDLLYRPKAPWMKEKLAPFENPLYCQKFTLWTFLLAFSKRACCNYLLRNYALGKGKWSQWPKCPWPPSPTTSPSLLSAHTYCLTGSSLKLVDWGRKLDSGSVQCVGTPWHWTVVAFQPLCHTSWRTMVKGNPPREQNFEQWF